MNDTSSLAFIGKVGAGIAYIHPYININGSSSDVGSKSLNNLIGFNSGWWRIVGVSTSVEAGLRYVISKPVYLELTDKVIFTSMSNIPVPSGTAGQACCARRVTLHPHSLIRRAHGSVNMVKRQCSDLEQAVFHKHTAFVGACICRAGFGI